MPFRRAQRAATAACVFLVCVGLFLSAVPAGTALAQPAGRGQQSGDARKKPKSRSLRWDPPPVDAPFHLTASSTPCQLETVLEQAGNRASEMVANLQNFTAQEDVQYQIVGRAFNLQDFGSEQFEYVVSFGPPENGLVVEEYRHPIHGSSSTAAATQDNGLPEMALLFLPELQQDYEMACEGGAERNGRVGWVVHFQQRPERPRRTFAFHAGGRNFPARLKGRAWVAADTGEILHLETGLIEEIPAVHVKHWYLSIDYAPVQFQSRPVSIWLPQSADGYCDFGDHRTIVYHTFSEFMLFSVQTGQRIAKPKAP